MSTLRSADPCVCSIQCVERDLYKACFVFIGLLEPSLILALPLVSSVVFLDDITLFIAFNQSVANVVYIPSVK